MRHHILKMEAPYCDAKLAGIKPWEIRKNDRDFQPGDTVEFVAITEDGQLVPHGIRGIHYEITYVLGTVGLLMGWVVFTTRSVNEKS